MDGFKQIKSFYSWVFNNPDKVRPTHISLYLFLWNQNNRANWVEWFKCPYDLAMQGACIGSKGTYYKCLDDLTGWKLIEYKKGLNNYKAPQIKLIQLYNSAPLTEQVTVPLSGQLSEPLTVLLTGNIYKLVTVNHKLVNDNLVFWLKSLDNDPVNDLSYSFDEFWKKYPRKVAKSKCEKKFNKLKKEQREKIKTTLDAFIEYKPFETYTHPNPETYLNQQRWDDEIPTDKPNKIHDPMVDYVKRNIELYGDS